MLIPRQVAEKFTKRALKVVDQLERLSQPNLIDLIKYIYEARGSLGSNFLKSFNLNEQSIKALDALAVEVRLHSPAKAEQQFIASALTRAAAAASQWRHQFVGTHHLLYGALSEMNKRASLRDTVNFLSKPATTLEQSLKAILETGSRFPELGQLEMLALEEQMFKAVTEGEEPEGGGVAVKSREKEAAEAKTLKRPPGRGKPLPTQFGQDLTEKARQNKLDILVGREPEINRLIQVLCRRTKSNPLLIGEAGVGKTAIVHGLAQRMVEGAVPAGLFNKRIYDVRLSLLVAGTMFRGEFEARLESIVQEAKRNEVILFIDEIHNIVGAGSAQGSLDAANILKPPLAQGEIQVIGATTLEEYRRYIERDKALERRFQPIFVDEPTLEEAKAILSGAKKVYETFHNVEITEAAVDAAVELSSRYTTDRFLPDKAFDLMDEAAARWRSQRIHTKQIQEIRRLSDLLQECLTRKEREIEKAAYDTAFQIKQEERWLRARIATLERGILETGERQKAIIDVAEITNVVAEQTGVPLTQLGRPEQRRLHNLERDLAEKIVGQEAAIKALAQSIRRARTGVSRAGRPLGSFMFLGPTGVGKTALTRHLAEVVFGPDALVKLDMSEFMEPHSISRLLGAPAGYVGYGDSNQFSQTIRHRPYSVVLFDEVEKAHPQIHNVLLQILEDGRVTDASGVEINFENTIVILTSNIGTARFTETAAIGFGAAAHNPDALPDPAVIEQETLHELKERLKPELLNRLDEIIVFKPLGKKAISTIVARALKDLAERVKDELKIDLSVSASAKRYLNSQSFQPRQGARLVNRVIQKYAEDALARALVAGEVRAGDKVVVNINKQGVATAKRR